MQKLSLALSAAALLILSACSESTRRAPPDDGKEFQSSSKGEASAVEADQAWASCVTGILSSSGVDWSADAVQFFADSPPWNRAISGQMSEGFASAYSVLDAHCASRP